MNIKNHRELLNDVAHHLKKIDLRNKLTHVNVHLFEDDECVLKANLTTFLNYISNDIYWNEETNWSNADRATVEIY